MTRHEALALLAKVPRQKVKTTVQDLTDKHRYAHAICVVRMRGQTEWTKPEWDAVLQELDACTMLIGDWLELEALI